MLEAVFNAICGQEKKKIGKIRTGLLVVFNLLTYTLTNFFFLQVSINWFLSWEGANFCTQLNAQEKILFSIFCRFRNVWCLWDSLVKHQPFEPLVPVSFWLPPLSSFSSPPPAGNKNKIIITALIWNKIKTNVQIPP